jgi:hypothetical protein
VHVLAGSDWSYGASILTFVFPELLFIFVAAALYVAYSMPHAVPGYRYEVARRASAPATAPGQAGEHGGQSAAGEGGSAASAAGDVEA